MDRNTKAAILVVCIAFVPLAPGAESFDDSGLIVRQFRSPVEQPGDLAWDGEALWIADWQEGELVRCDPATGERWATVTPPCYRPRGLTWGGGAFYIADDYEGLIYAFDPESGLASTAYRSPTGTGQGLAWDGRAVWLAENGERTLQKLIPEDGTVLTYFPAPQADPAGIAFDGRYLWVTARRHDRIYMIDPESGKAITSFFSPGPYPCGLAPAGDGRLWVADFEDGMISLCAPREAVAHQVRDWRETEIRMTCRIDNQGPGTVRDAVVHFAVPEEGLENQVLHGPLAFTAGVPEIHADRWGQTIATFRRDRIGPGEQMEVGYTARGRVGELNYILIPEKVGKLSDIPRSLREAYTADGERLQVGSELVQGTARSVVGEEENPYWIMRRIYDWVISALEY